MCGASQGWVGGCAFRSPFFSFFLLPSKSSQSRSRCLRLANPELGKSNPERIESSRVDSGLLPIPFSGLDLSSFACRDSITRRNQHHHHIIIIFRPHRRRRHHHHPHPSAPPPFQLGRCGSFPSPFFSCLFLCRPLKPKIVWMAAS